MSDLASLVMYQFIRELRLMKDQPNHRFYAACLVAVVVVVVPAFAFLLR
jgi:hypothetical protein